MAWHMSRFCLNSLSTTNLKSFGSSIRVERHILSFERSWRVSILQKDTAESCCNDAFPYVTSCTGKHNRMKFLFSIHDLHTELSYKFTENYRNFSKCD